MTDKAVNEPTDDPPVTITRQHRQQVANWRFLVVVLAVALFGQALGSTAYAWKQSTDRQENQEIVDCRGKTGARLASAQVDNDLAFDDLLLALSDETRRAAREPGTNPYDPEIREIRRTRAQLKVARDARVAFEEHPTGNC